MRRKESLGTDREVFFYTSTFARKLFTVCWEFPYLTNISVNSGMEELDEVWKHNFSVSGWMRRNEVGRN